MAAPTGTMTVLLWLRPRISRKQDQKCINERDSNQGDKKRAERALQLPTLGGRVVLELPVSGPLHEVVNKEDKELLTSLGDMLLESANQFHFLSFPFLELQGLKGWPCFASPSV